LKTTILRGSPWGWEARRALDLGLTPIFAFDHNAWNPVKTAKGEFLSAVREAFETALNRHVTEVENLATGQLEASQRVLDAGDFDWAVEFQVREQTYGKIARDYATSRPDHFVKTVKRAVRRVLRIIGLPQRHARAGRPPNVAEE